MEQEKVMEVGLIQNTYLKNGRSDVKLDLWLGCYYIDLSAMRRVDVLEQKHNLIA